MLPKVRRNATVGLPDNGPRVLPRRFIAVASATVEGGREPRPHQVCAVTQRFIFLSGSDDSDVQSARLHRTQQLGTFFQGGQSRCNVFAGWIVCGRIQITAMFQRCDRIKWAPCHIRIIICVHICRHRLARVCLTCRPCSILACGPKKAYHPVWAYATVVGPEAPLEHCAAS